MSTVRIQVRRGTEAQWAQVNPILAAGEVGLESDTNYFKFGTGSVAWNALPYANEPLSDLENRVGAYLEDNLLGQANGVASLNSSGKVPASQLDITELSQDAVNTAIVPGTGIIKAYDDVANTITVSVDTSVIAVKSELAESAQDAVNTAMIAGTGVTKSYDDVANTITVSADTSVMATKMYAESYTDQAFAQLVGAAPAVLNTLSELSDALGDDANFASTVTTALTAKADASVVQGALTAIDTKAPLNSPTFTGGVVLPSTTTIGLVSEAEIAYVNGVTSNIQVQLDAKAPLAGPIFTGSVTLPATTSIGDVSNTEIGYLNNVTSNVQVQIDTKAPTEGAIFTGSITLPATTSIGDVSNTEIGYLNNVTSNVQSQLDTKAPLASPVFTGTVGGITKGMVGLSNVDDTTDAAKPISTATQTALDLKANAGDLTTHAADETNVHGIANTADLATKAYADSAVSTHTLDTTAVHGIADTSLLALKSEVAAVTATSLGLGNVNNTADTSKPVSTAQASAIATAKAEAIADATSQVNALLTGAPAALNTLDELAAALGDDANFAATVTTSLGLKVDSLTPISQKTASYTLSSLTERDDLIEMGSASALTITIPPASAVDYPIGTSIDILQTGAGQVTVAAGAGVTVNATPGLKLRTQWSSATLFKRAQNTWVVFGDLTA
jgi:hypothetical protein